jgi:hypothetical protein
MIYINLAKSLNLKKEHFELICNELNNRILPLD